MCPLTTCCFKVQLCAFGWSLVSQPFLHTEIILGGLRGKKNKPTPFFVGRSLCIAFFFLIPQ